MWKLVECIGNFWSGWPSRHPLAVIVALALIVRLPFLAISSAYHPDEVLQYLEPAHRLVTGYGIITWEWREGMRSWFLPVLFAGPMKLSQTLWPGTLAYLPIIRGLAVLLSLTLIFSFFAIGSFVSRFHATIAAFVAAIWFELVAFSSHTLGEPIALALIMPAAALLMRIETAPARRLAIAGILLGLAAIVRFQYLPAIGVLVLFTCKLRFRQAWLPVATGGAVALLTGAGIDLALGVRPYEWVFRNFASNLLEGRSAAYGVSSPFYYPAYIIVYHWQAVSVLILAFSAMSAKRYPALFTAAVVNLAVHSMIPHKEFRFILLSTAILVLFFALGVGDALRFIGERLSARSRLALVIATVTILTGTSFVLALGERTRQDWVRLRPVLIANQRTNEIEGLCGLGLFGTQLLAGGYTYLNRPVPMHLIGDAKDFAQTGPGFNVLIAPRSMETEIPKEYVRGQCIDEKDPIDDNARSAGEAKCIFRRPGSCKTAAPAINQTMIDIGQ